MAFYRTAILMAGMTALVMGLGSLLGGTADTRHRLERITFSLGQIEGDPRQASPWLCCISPLIR